METGKTGAGFVFRCDEKGIVSAIVLDYMGFSGHISPGMRFHSFIGHDDIAKLDGFLEELQIHGMSSGWDINVSDGSALETLIFSGIAAQDGFIILCARTRFDVCEMLFTLRFLDNDTSLAVQALSRELFQANCAGAGRDSRIYDEFARMNNEMINLARELQKKNTALEQAQNTIKVLRGFLPICANCKNIRNDEGFWIRIEEYIRDHSEAEFSHGLCPDCLKSLYPEFSE
ncbi:MAG: hypothetical protein WCX65_01465 [bacterium]